MWSRTHLIRLHLQTGRGFIEDMIPPVEGELVPFLMTNLVEKSTVWVYNMDHTIESDERKPSIKLNVTHPSFATFYFDLDSFWYAVLSSPQSFTWAWEWTELEISTCLTYFRGYTKEIRVSYPVPSHDAGVASLQTSRHDFSLVQLLPSVERKVSLRSFKSVFLMGQCFTYLNELNRL